MRKKSKPVSSYDLVHIFWHDAALHGREQVSLDDVKDYTIIRGHVAGWLVDESKEHVTIAMDFFPAEKGLGQDSFRGLSSYPKSGIDKMTIVKTLEIHDETTKN